MSVTANQILWPVISGVVTVLFAGNLYFAKRTIDRLDSIEQLAWSLRQEMAVLRATLTPATSTSLGCINPLASRHALTHKILSHPRCLQSR